MATFIADWVSLRVMRPGGGPDIRFVQFMHKTDDPSDIALLKKTKGVRELKVKASDPQPTIEPAAPKGSGRSYKGRG
jgi:hypothetical protein